MKAASDDLRERVVPAVAPVAVLRLGAHVGDARLDLHEIEIIAPGIEPASALAPRRRGPADTGQQLDQLGLAGAVGPNHQALVAGLDAQGGAIDGPPAAEDDGTLLEFDADARQVARHDAASQEARP